MKNIFVVVLSVVIAGIFAGPIRQAGESGASEEYVFSLVIDSAKYPWPITSWAKNTASGKLIEAISIYTHDLDHSTNVPAPVLSTDPGYQGYTIDHKVNGVVVHSWVLPKCKLVNLEKALLQYTGPQEIKTQYLGVVKAATESCKPKP